MLYLEINGFGVFRSRLCFKVRAKKIFFFYSDTNFNGGNKTPTPSPKGFFGQSSSFPIGRAYSLQKGCLIYSPPLEGCLPIKKGKKYAVGRELSGGYSNTLDSRNPSRQHSALSGSEDSLQKYSKCTFADPALLGGEGNK